MTREQAEGVVRAVVVYDGWLLVPDGPEGDDRYLPSGTPEPAETAQASGWTWGGGCVGRWRGGRQAVRRPRVGPDARRWCLGLLGVGRLGLGRRHVELGVGGDAVVGGAADVRLSGGRASDRTPGGGVSGCWVSGRLGLGRRHVELGVGGDAVVGGTADVRLSGGRASDRTPGGGVSGCWVSGRLGLG
ncbi:hypothetical protein ACIP3A_09280, partial [Streptomyces tricolor]